ncbi:hypothetical protein DRO49_03550 [Candidatus Bathyarchaeota archaeon]|nr:MAG: hypothetical protein DRO49_03550 [Candidatus Bathyarchaeota archaeon]
MRSYIFTDSELKAILKWIEEGEMSQLCYTTLTRIRENLDRLLLHIEILQLVLEKMKREGRLVGWGPRLVSRSR